MIARTALACLALLVLPVPALTAQEPELEIRAFDLASLFAREYRGRTLSARLPLAASYRDLDDEVEPGRWIEPDRVIDLIRDNVGGETWDEDGRFLWQSHDHVVVAQEKHVLDEIERFLSSLTRLLARPASVEVYAFASGSWPDDGKSIFTSEEASELVSQSRTQLLGALKLRVREVGELATGRETTFTADQNVEVATRVAAADPVLRVLRSGLELRASVMPTPGDELFLSISVTDAHLEDRGDTVTAAPGDEIVQLPVVESKTALASAVVANGGAILVGCATPRGELALLVRARVAPEPSSPAAGAALLHLGALTAPTTDGGAFALGRPVMAPHGFSGDEVPDPEALMYLDQVIEVIKHGVNRHWDEDETKRLDEIDGRIWLRTTPDEVRRARALVRRLHDSMARNVSLELRAGTIGAGVAVGADDLTAVASLLPYRAVVSTVTGHGFRAAAGRERSYIRDYDVEIADTSIALDPIISTVFDGLALRGFVTAAPSQRIGVAGRITLQWLTKPMMGTRAPDRHGANAPKISLPETRINEIDVREELVPGTWTLLELAPVPAGGGERSVVLMRANP